METGKNLLALGEVSFRWLDQYGVPTGEPIWTGQSYVRLGAEQLEVCYDEFTALDAKPPTPDGIGRLFKICLMRDGEIMAEILPYTYLSGTDTVHIPA